MKWWLLMMFCGVAVAGDFPRIDQAVKDFDREVTRLRTEFDARPVDPHEFSWVRAKLQHMVEIDQFARTYREKIGLHSFPMQEQLEFSRQWNMRGQDIDLANQGELKMLLKIHPWFTISKFGAEADQNAWLLVQHADNDREFQQGVLAILEPLSRTGETRPSNYAYLFDRVAVNFNDPAQRKPQWYGTQGRCTGPGTWEPWPVDSPGQLDARRRDVGLPPMAEYQKVFKDICHESMEDSIRKFQEAADKAAQP